MFEPRNAWWEEVVSKLQVHTLLNVQRTLMNSAQGAVAAYFLQLFETTLTSSPTSTRDNQPTMHSFERSGKHLAWACLFCALDVNFTASFGVGGTRSPGQNVDLLTIYRACSVPEYTADLGVDEKKIRLAMRYGAGSSILALKPFFSSKKSLFFFIFFFFVLFFPLPRFRF